jgi:trans-aconitate methyltransferase
MLSEHPSSHLIVAHPAESHVAEMARLIDRLIDRMQPRGAFATTLMKAQGNEAVHCAFEQQREALRFAGTMSAKPINRYVGWETQCAFTLDKTLADAIARALER